MGKNSKLHQRSQPGQHGSTKRPGFPTQNGIFTSKCCRIPRPSNLRTARVSRARSVSWFGVLKYSKQLESEHRVTAGKPIKLIKLLKLLMAPFCWIVWEGLSFWKNLMITFKNHPAPVGSCSAIFRSRPMSRSASFLLCRWEGCCWLQISSSMSVKLRNPSTALLSKTISSSKKLTWHLKNS